MLYVVELVATIAVCYPTPPAETSAFVTGGSFVPLAGERILKFWWQNGASTRGPIRQISEFEQSSVDFIFMTGLTFSDGLWRVWTEVEMPHRVYLSKFSGVTEGKGNTDNKVIDLIAQPEPFLSISIVGNEALDFAHTNGLPFRVRPVDTR